LDRGGQGELPRNTPFSIPYANYRLKPWKQCQFLLHIIAQLKGDNNKAISWNKINMPGRTTKSLQNMWTKINKTISEMEAASANGEEFPKAIREFAPRRSKVLSGRN
jgi:hypothetical protein